MGHMIREQLEYARSWKKETRDRRRSEWILANGPCRLCGKDTGLQVDHVDPKQKTCDVADLWLRSKEMRDQELAKCQVLCISCHKQKTDIGRRVAAEKRRGKKVERVRSPAEWVELTCVRCSNPFKKRAAKERFISKTRVNGPFCSFVCRSVNSASERWKKYALDPATEERYAKMRNMGIAGIAVSHIARQLNARPSIVKRVLDEAGIPREKRRKNV